MYIGSQIQNQICPSIKNIPETQLLSLINYQKTDVQDYPLLVNNLSQTTIETTLTTFSIRTITSAIQRYAVPY